MARPAALGASGIAAALLLGAAVTAQTAPPAVTPVPIPGSSGGIGFDDLRFAPGWKRIVAPAGRTGSIALVEPGTLAVTTIGGFSSSERYAGGHGEGPTSADEGAGFLFAIDRTSDDVVAVDQSSRSIVARAKLTGAPDYVRFVEPTSEVWVTEPDPESIEVFRFERGNPPKLSAAGVFAVPGGPESLVVDAANGRAYTHSWKSDTMALDVRARRVAATWRNGCSGSRGIALDAARGFLFVGCAEGKAVVLDTKSGRQLGSISSGSGVDIIDFDPHLSHLYFPGGRSATMAILGVSGTGGLTLLGTVPTAEGAHCVATDLSGTAYVCDPRGGRLLAVRDPYAPTR
jgi:DNA-binding beta-propeller fold protein YncE